MTRKYFEIAKIGQVEFSIIDKAVKSAKSSSLKANFASYKESLEKIDDLSLDRIIELIDQQMSIHSQIQSLSKSLFGAQTQISILIEKELDFSFDQNLNKL
jgi:hypothetical protein